jgi:hypothetical protein
VRIGKTREKTAHTCEKEQQWLAYIMKIISYGRRRTLLLQRCYRGEKAGNGRSNVTREASKVRKVRAARTGRKARKAKGGTGNRET